ncbi:MAG: TRAP transporter small permease subunit, partial [Candidatus Puniceispirillum sp.]
MILRLWSKVTRSAEIIAAIILAAIFITFLLQIFTRYAPRIAWLAPVEPIQHWMQSLVPIGWTVNLISLLWVWLIFFSCSFFVREKDHVVFDVLVDVLPKTWRRIMASVTSLFLVGIMLYAFQPTYD